MSAVAGTDRKAPGGDHSWIRTTWPIDRVQALQLVIAVVAGIGIFAAIGLVMTDIAAPNAITRADEDIAQWFVDGRTPRLDDLAHWGAFLADTLTKIVITAIFAFGALAAWRRWHEAIFVIATLVVEATVFIVVTTIVGRPRPDVPKLQESPVNSSFPSGHVAAATVYGAFVIVVFWHTTSKVWRSLAVAVAVAVVAALAWARMYQGMHFASDVVTGIVLGLATLATCYYVLGRPDQAIDADVDARADEQAPSPTPSPMPVPAADHVE